MRLRSYLAILGAAGVSLGLASTSGGCTITTNADDAGIDGAVPPVDTDSGIGVDAGDAAVTPAFLTFAPTNLSGLTAVDTTNLVDVSIAATTSIDSDVDDSATIGSGTGSVLYQVVTQTDGSKLGVYIAKSWSVSAGSVVHAKGAFPLVLIATNTIFIGGTLDASSAKNVPGAGAVAPTTVGVGVGAGGSGNQVLGAAASGGSFCGPGGAGGFFTAATAATVAPAFGATTLSPLFAGASGGAGIMPPGAGGGAIQLVAATSITVETGGFLAANGGGGANSGTAADNAVQIGSGGGSGGALLLESPIVTINGTVSANGGGGGGNSGSYGQDGQNSAVPALGTGTGTGLGGSGSGGAVLNGTAGANGSGATGTGNDISPGGGGGGAGWVRINTTSGVATFGANIVSSPASGTTCLVQGTLTH